MIIYSTKVILLICPISKFILFWNVRNLKLVLMVNDEKKNCNIKCKICGEKRINTSLMDL